MEKREKQRLVIIFMLVLIMAVYMDITGVVLEENGIIRRNPSDGTERIVNLEISAEDILEGYLYQINVEPQKVTEQDAKEYIEQAKKEIEVDFENIKDQVMIRDTFVTDMVEAEWSFYPSGLISSDGTIQIKEIPQTGVLITAQVHLRCGAYDELYIFPFEITKDSISRKKILLAEIEAYVSAQMQKEGTEEVILPKEIDGIDIVWREKEDYLTVKIVLLEITASFLILISKKKVKKKQEETQNQSMEILYSDIVNHLSILLEAGMTSRQAWQRMAVQYEERCANSLVSHNPVYEAISRMSRRFSEGESERRIYEMFMEEIDLLSYRRLMRMLISNLGKGNKDICVYLDAESKRAYDERILLAKKQGEEASTKLLIPLMLMLVLVMFVVIVPAMIGFTI